MIAIDTATFVVAAVALLFLEVPSPVRSDLAASGSGRPSLWADVRENLLFIWDRRPVLWLVSTFTVANLAVAPVGILVPLLVKFNLADDWQAQGYTFDIALALLSVTAGIGGLIGGLLISTWGGLKKRRVYGVLSRHCCGRSRSRIRVCRSRPGMGRVLHCAAVQSLHAARGGQSWLRTVGRIETLAADRAIISALALAIVVVGRRNTPERLVRRCPEIRIPDTGRHSNFTAVRILNDVHFSNGREGKEAEFRAGRVNYLMGFLAQRAPRSRHQSAVAVACRQGGTRPLRAGCRKIRG